MKKLAISLTLLLLATPLIAEPFMLAEPALGASAAPNDITLGAGDQGFLLAGTASHRPIVIPLSPEGEPRIEGTLPLGLPSASSVGEPIFVDGRWVVLLMGGHMLPDRMPIAELSPDGSLLGEPHLVPWEHSTGVDLAWNGHTFLAAAITRRTTSTLTDLSVRTIAADLESAGPPRLIATDVSGVDLVGTSDGFLIAWTDDKGVWAQHLDSAAKELAPPSQLAAASNVRHLGIAANDDGALIVWAEGDDSHWTIRAAYSSSAGGLRPIDSLAEMTGSSFPVVYVEPLGDGFVVAWQPVDYDQGRRKGQEIFLQRLSSDGIAVEEPWMLPNLIGEELLTAIASREDELLVTYTRHFVSVGTPIWGTIVSDRSATTPQFISLRRASVGNLKLTSGGDGTTWGSWIESTATGSTLNVARWNTDGEPMAESTLLDLPERIWHADIASNGPDTMITWHQGYAVFAAPLAGDGTFARDPFYVAIGNDSGSSPREPAIAWDGERFVIAWKEAGITAAHVVPEGVQRVLGIVAGIAGVPPGHNKYYGVVAFELAVAEGTLGIVADITETSFCVGIPCPSRSLVGWVATDGSTPQPFQLGPEGKESTVESNGDSFMMGWLGADGIHVMPFDRTGNPGDERLAFRWPGAGSPAITSTRNNFTVGFPYNTSAWGRVGFVTVDADANVVTPARGFETWSERPTTTLEIANTGADLLFAWIGPAAESASSSSIMGQLASRAESNPPPPVTPSGVHVAALDQGSVRLTWNAVPGADEYQIDHRYNVNDSYRWVHTRRTDQTSVSTKPPPLRIMALGKGGASEPRLIDDDAARRRAVGRR